MTFARRNPRIGAIVSVKTSDADSPAIAILDAFLLRDESVAILLSSLLFSLRAR